MAGGCLEDNGGRTRIYCAASFPDELPANPLESAGDLFWPQVRETNQESPKRVRLKLRELEELKRGQEGKEHQVMR